MLKTGKAVLFYSSLLLFQSCYRTGIETVPLSEGKEGTEVFSGFNFAEPLVASGKAKLEFSNYRFRGVFRLHFENGAARIEFHHSGLFGAINEEGTVFISKNGVTVLDEKRGTLYDTESSKSLIREATGAEIEPSDILLALLLEFPRYSELGSPETSSGPHGWRMKGLYGGRMIDITGERQAGPVKLDICGDKGAWCFSVFWRYGEPRPAGRYPERIVMTKSDGSVRINMDIESVSEGASDTN